MIREEEIREIAESYAKGIAQDAVKEIYCRTDFIAGAEWADKHPHWISVEDELPPQWETNPNVSEMVITFGHLDDSNIAFVELQRYHFGDGRWLYGKATHWMPFQFPEKGGEHE